MRTTSKIAAAAIGAAALLPFAGAGTAQAADGNTTATLRPVALNNVPASGTAMVTGERHRIDVTMAASRARGGQPPTPRTSTSARPPATSARESSDDSNRWPAQHHRGRSRLR